MDETEGWVAAYGPQEGQWLRAKFAHVMQGEEGVHHVRVACADDAAERDHYEKLVAEAEDPNQGEAGDWEVISPHTGKRYWMGCNW